MKRNLQSLLLIPLLLAFSACASFQGTSGKLLASTADTVDAAMKGWAAYVVATNMPETNQTKVRVAYAEYQTAMAAAQKAYVAGVTGDQTGWQAASSALTAASSSLTALIAQLEGK